METKRCSIDGCSRRVLGRGWCAAHYSRWRRYGDPTAGRDNRRPGSRWTLEELLAQTRPGDDGCMEWTGGRAKAGYGCTSHGGENWTTHRLAFALANGDLLPGLCVMHRCDNPACINPDHLFAGTKGDNVADMVAKGRKVTARGEAAGRARLTEADVLDIRRRHAAGESLRELGSCYGVSHVAILNVVKRRTWSHVP